MCLRTGGVLRPGDAEQKHAGDAEGLALRGRLSHRVHRVPLLPWHRGDGAPDAFALLHEEGLDFTHGEDFGAPHETAIGARFDRPVMIHRWPVAIKSFYMKRDPANPKLALGVDMIASEGYGELIGGSQREDDAKLLEQRIKEHDLPGEAFRWFMDLRRYGSVPHGGFGLGLERTVAWICGVEHLRECIPFPRMLHRIYP